MNRRFRRAAVLFLSLALAATVAALPGGAYALVPTDLPPSHWAYEAVMEAIEAGDVSGYPDGTFRPEKSVTVAEFVKLAAIAATGRDPGPAPGDFWYESYADLAQETGMIEASHKPLFMEMANRPASREVAALYAGFALAAMEDLPFMRRLDNQPMPLFKDVRDPMDLAKIAAAVKGGLMVGYQDIPVNRFDPQRVLTRAEAVAITSRLRDADKRMVYEVLEEEPCLTADDASRELVLGCFEKGGDSCNYSPLEDDSYTPAGKLFVDEVYRYTNLVREEAGLSPLLPNKDLAAIAFLKAKDFVVSGYFGHLSPLFGSPFDMLHRWNIHYEAACENIARRQTSGKSVVEAWMLSPSHRANILNPLYTHLGVGYYECQGINYVVQLSVRPLR